MGDTEFKQILAPLIQPINYIPARLRIIGPLKSTTTTGLTNIQDFD